MKLAIVLLFIPICLLVLSCKSQRSRTNADLSSSSSNSNFGPDGYPTKKLTLTAVRMPHCINSNTGRKYGRKPSQATNAVVYDFSALRVKDFYTHFMPNSDCRGAIIRNRYYDVYSIDVDENREGKVPVWVRGEDNIGKFNQIDFYIYHDGDLDDYYRRIKDYGNKICVSNPKPDSKFGYCTTIFYSRILPEEEVDKELVK